MLPRRPLFALPLLLPLLLAACLGGSSTLHRSDVTVTDRGRADAGAVACVEAHAARVGARVLAAGGNAVDAAVATALALAVTWPPAGNLGGGGVMVVVSADGTREVVEFRETAPAAVGPDLFLDGDDRYDPAVADDPWRCVGVPGSPAGLYLAHARHGRLPWRDLVQPAVELAQQGFEVDATLARFLADAAPGLAAVPASADVFLHPDGSPLVEGERLRQPDLATTLAALRDQGPDGFYGGAVAAALVGDVRRHGGLLALDDLSDYRALVREPLLVPLEGHLVLSAPPVSSGGVAFAQITGQLERLGWSELDLLGADELHLYAEAARRAFADRARALGDPDQGAVDTGTLLAPPHLDALARSIDVGRATPSADLGPTLAPAFEPEHTTHLSVIDRDGGAVALTTTLEASFGGKAVAATTGVLLNNQLRDFNRVPGLTSEDGLIGTAPNLPGPGKRPLTSMNPLIVLDPDGRAVLATGSPGGRTIINTTARLVLAVIGRGVPLGQAVDMPRVHHQWFPDRLRIEPHGLSDEVLAALRQRGHALELPDERPPLFGTQGAAHSVAFDPITGEQFAVGDPRRDGKVGLVRRR